MSEKTFSRSGWLGRLTGSILPPRAALLGIIMTVALIGFEIFNYSTTELALSDLLGGLAFAGLRWATILAIAFCCIDFAGIARLFAPENDTLSKIESWFLLGAWLLAASMNAVLTWWGVSLSLVNRTLQSSSFIATQTLLEVVPVFVALLVWLTRILLIGTFSRTSQHLFEVDARPYQAANQPIQSRRPHPGQIQPRQPAYAAPTPRPALRQIPRPAVPNRAEPEYIPEPGYAASRPAFLSMASKTEQNSAVHHS